MSSNIFLFWEILKWFIHRKSFMLLKSYYFHSVFLKPLCKSLKSVLCVKNVHLLSKLQIFTSLMMFWLTSSVCRICVRQEGKKQFEVAQLVGKETFLAMKWVLQKIERNITLRWHFYSHFTEYKCTTSDGNFVSCKGWGVT